MAKLNDTTINGTLQVTGATTLNVVLPISCGGTGATTAEEARTNLEITPVNIGAVPTTRTINNKALSSNISLTASDVGAAASSHNHDASNITSGTLPIARGGTGTTTLSSIFSITTHTIVISSISASSTTSYTETAISNSGYIALGIIGFYATGSGSSYIIPVQNYLSGTTWCHIFRNISTAARSNITCAIRVLWVKYN